MPKISVITGFYNRSQHLERTIESILKQSFVDFELIVFDDHSTDDTAIQLQKLSAKYDDARFRFITHETNKGFVKGLSDAIAESTGEYIAIQGSGDISLPDRLRLQNSFLDTNPEVGAVGGRLYIIQEDGGSRTLHDPDLKLYSFQDLMITSPFTHGEVMFRRDIYNAVGGYRTAFKYAQDRDLWLRMSKISKLAVLPEIIYHRFTLMDGVSFVPQKTIQQKAYSLAAIRLAQMPTVEESKNYSLIEEHGPTALIPVSDPEVQAFIPRAALRLSLYGSPEIGLKMLRDFMLPSMAKYSMSVFIRIYSSKLVAPFQNPLRKTFRRIRFALRK